ncbi:XAC2610-related protein [Flavobacterium sp. NPDC079362]|uniref:XAC2610-related protein n=1 Tax=Flavobacterium sp. NPDC079362 TaxID=3390566 RepID=UPI003CFEFCE8
MNVITPKVTQKILTALLFLVSLDLAAQISYTGFIDKYPIEFITDLNSEGSGNAIYAYSNYDTPIEIKGILKQKILTFYEKDKTGKNTAKMTFENFNPKSKKLEGVWTDLNTKKELEITLSKTFEVEYGDAAEWKNIEILQPVSLKGKYFKLIISKIKGGYAKVTGVKILEKKTDKLIQQIALECELWGLNNINTGDYNFDGIEDFSVFESSYAGPNTSRLYFLYNPKTGKYFESSFSGTSLQFDSKTKRIEERNQCCAGRSVTTAKYKVVNDKMVLIKQTCLEYDDKTGDYKKVKCD